MEFENKNIVFTVFNKKLVFTLSAFVVISLIVVILFFTVIREEYIVLGLPFVFFVFVLPIFIFGMRNKIIYRLTEDELQYRGENKVNVKWADTKSYNINNNEIVLSLQNGSSINLPILNFNKDELNKALGLYIK